MSDHLLVQYEVSMPNGYPWYWDHRALVDPENEKGPRHLSIKDYIRELAGHRCERCGHPYAKGEHPIDEHGQLWSRCDEQCRHPRSMHDSRWKRASRDSWLRGVPTLADLAAIEDAGETIDIEALWRVLTVHHLDEDKLNCRWWNLVALCQRCHLRMQRAVVMDRVYHYEHSEWFRPYAAGFYAWKYLGEDLEREETLNRLPELLALEHRFTQEALL